MRLFVAVELPDEIKDELARAIESLHPSAPDAKWVPRNNIHLTLSFLGEVVEERVAPIEAAIRNSLAGHTSIPTRLTEGGAFPSQKRARVLWVGLDDDQGSLAALATATERGLEQMGLPPEARAWTPHVTLARFRTPADVRPILPIDVQPIAFEVPRVTLFRSRLGRPAPRYEAIAQVPLGS